METSNEIIPLQSNMRLWLLSSEKLELLILVTAPFLNNPER
jgi:hypothetical protein